MRGLTAKTGSHEAHWPQVQLLQSAAVHTMKGCVCRLSEVRWCMQAAPGQERAAMAATVVFTAAPGSAAAAVGAARAAAELAGSDSSPDMQETLQVSESAPCSRTSQTQVQQIVQVRIPGCQGGSIRRAACRSCTEQGRRPRAARGPRWRHVSATSARTLTRPCRSSTAAWPPRRCAGARALRRTRSVCALIRWFKSLNMIANRH